jgi:hypothetical protein
VTDSDARCCLDEVTRQVDRLYRAMREMDDPAPPFLFHYTSPKGLIGIVTSRTLWASSADCLNDSSEPKYAIGLLKECFDEIVSTLPADSIAARAFKDYWAWFQKTLEKEGPHVYVFCLSEHDDLLSQWRGYGGQCGGYAVGFSSTKLLEYLRAKGRSLGRYLMRVVYGDTDQRTSAIRVFQDIVAIGNEAEEKYPAISREPEHFIANEIMKRLRSAVFSEAVRLRATFKVQAFHEEAEWRIVQFLDPRTQKPEVQFRPGSMALTPYVALDLGTPPIEKITIGPTLDPVLARQSLDLLFAKQEYSQVSIKSSDIPYRQ